MNWESVGEAVVEERKLPHHFDELERTKLDWITAEARDDETDDFEDFDEEDFDDDFDDDFEEEHDEEYEAENEEYPDDDFGTGLDVDEDLESIEIEGDIDADFEDAVPGVEPVEDADEGVADEDAGEP